MHIRSFATCALGASVLAGSAPALAGQATFQLLTTQDAPAVTIDEFGRTLVRGCNVSSVEVPARRLTEPG